MAISGISAPYNRKDYSSPLSRGGVPNWDRIPHKGMERPTEAEFEEIIDELAKELAEVADEIDSVKGAAVWQQVYTALAQYISVVSPDRKAIVEETKDIVNQLTTQTDYTDVWADVPQTLVDYLNARDGYVKISPSSNGHYDIQLESGTTITPTGSISDPSACQIRSSSSGQEVLGINGNEWYYARTHQEQQLHQDFLKRFNATVRKYRSEYAALGFDTFA